MSDPGSSVVLEKALTYLKQGDAAGADILLTSFLSQYPDDADGQNLAGLIKQQLGDLPAAIAHLEAAAKNAPDIHVYSVNLSMMLLENGQASRAKTVLKKAREVHPTVAELAVNLADAHARLGETDAAEAELRAALSLNSDLAQAAASLCELLQGQERFEDAVEVARTTFQHWRDNAAAMRLLGMAELKAGHPGRAVDHLLRATELDPDRMDILLNLGVAQKQSGRYAEAETTYRSAIEKGYQDADLLNNLANVLVNLDKIDEAEQTFRQALDQDPENADLRKNLVLLFQDRGRYDDALQVADAGLERVPDHPGLLMAKGNTLRMMNKFQEAFDVLEHALKHGAEMAELHNNYALVLSILDDLDGAEAAFMRAIELNPTEPVLHNNLGALRIRSFKLDAAIEALNRSMALRPDYVDPMRNYATVMYLTGEVEEARAAFRRVLDLAPDDVASMHGLAIALWEDQIISEAIEKAERVLELNPDYNLTRNLLGVIRVDQRRVPEGLEQMKEAAKHDTVSAPAFLSNYLFSSMYDPSRSNQQVFEDHKAWGDRFASAAPNPKYPHVQSRDKSRRLRIGYVSPDFRAHSVSYFFEPIMQYHDRTSFEVFCYSNTIRTDVVTEGIQKAADGWIETSGLTDEHMMQRLRDDQLDIIINLGGHTAYNRMRAMACQTAPIQIEYLGYPHTSGVPAMTYRITDDRADPGPQADSFVTEQLIRMKDCFHCYRPHGKAPEPSAPPHLSAGHFTFASFNMLTKVNDGVLDAWTEIMRQVPDSHFLLKCKQLNEPTTVDAMKEAFERRGVDSSRLTMKGFVPSVKEHLGMYGTVDLALDTFPYNGTTTTCEAMWMGVPVLTIEGDRHSGRVGLSLMHAMGLTDELVTPDVDSYIKRAVEWAHDTQMVDALRSNMRPRMAASPLRDEVGFTRQLEQIYRARWEDWCDGEQTFERMPPSPLKPDESIQGLLNKQL